MSLLYGLQEKETHFLKNRNMEKLDYKNYPKVKPTIQNKYVLMENYQVENVRVPKGYETNGADVPKLFWWFVPPFKPKYLPAIIIHDYLCDKKKYSLADSLFESTLYKIEISFTTKTMVKAVKWYHTIKYKIIGW